MTKTQHGMVRVTVNGYSVWECISALQKAIRRGEEELAFFCVAELEASSTHAFTMAMNRLRVIAQEDVGLAAPVAVLFALQAVDQAVEWRKAEKPSWKMAVANAVAALCRAEKSRLADNMQTALMARRRKGWRPEIPDCALDKHTRRGKKMGRGFAHFVAVGTQLTNASSTVHDPYRAEAEAEWLSRDEQPVADQDGQTDAFGDVAEGE